jgi:hypothetical protein
MPDSRGGNVRRINLPSSIIAAAMATRSSHLPCRGENRSAVTQARSDGAGSSIVRHLLSAFDGDSSLPGAGRIRSPTSHEALTARLGVKRSARPAWPGASHPARDRSKLARGGGHISRISDAEVSWSNRIHLATRARCNRPHRKASQASAAERGRPQDHC